MLSVTRKLTPLKREENWLGGSRKQDGVQKPERWSSGKRGRRNGFLNNRCCLQCILQFRWIIWNERWICEEQQQKPLSWIKLLVVWKGVLVWVELFESMWLGGPIDPRIEDELSLDMACAGDCLSHRGKTQSKLLRIVVHWSQGHRGKIG